MTTECTTKGMTMTEYPYRNEIARRCLNDALGDLDILSGDAIGPSDVIEAVKVMRASRTIS